jgi:hypothetical protein
MTKIFAVALVLIFAIAAIGRIRQPPEKSLTWEAVFR